MQTRRIHRLRSHDYRRGGAYFITIGTWRMQPTLGVVTETGFEPSLLGIVTGRAWAAIPEHFPTVGLDAWCLMPNHLHGILWLAPVNGDPRLSPRLGHVVQQFKSSAVRVIHRTDGSTQTPVWHRDYFDRVIRSPEQLRATRRYIELNPQRWWEGLVREKGRRPG